MQTMKVYFNNSCKICKAEIDIYKKEKVDDINWVDITNNNQANIETKKNSKELLRRLHVEKNGEIFSGAKASATRLYTHKCNQIICLRSLATGSFNCSLYLLTVLLATTYPSCLRASARAWSLSGFFLSSRSMIF